MGGKVVAMATKGKVKEMLAILRKDGWEQIKSKGGDHRQFKHAVKRGRVTVPGKPSDDLPVGTWDSILRQAKLK
jgi:predicted RNA binding protein YcfA (HicA-like mRNA interferase family)